MNILVTGGSGYLGSHLIYKILKNEDVPVVIDFEKPLFDVPFIQGDLSDISITRKCFEDYKIDCVVHLASLISVGDGEDDPLSYYNNNLKSTLNILECMKDFNVKKIIFASSAAVYGESDDKITEDSPKNPVCVYGRSKLMCEKIIEDFYSAYGIEYTILRLFNLSGLDKNVPFEIRQIMHLIDVANEIKIGHKEYLNVFGDNYPTPDGTCLRDYVHVMDVAEAVILSTKTSYMGHLNIGSAHASVLEVLKHFDVLFKITDRRKGDAAMLINVSSKAKNILGWNPKYTDIKQIVDSMKML